VKAAAGICFVCLSLFSCDFLGWWQPSGPAFSGEEEIVIAGYTGDAMEPFISADGNTLFFNSLNDAQDTNILYALKTASGSFDYAGEVAGVNGEVPHLDAVSSMSDDGVFCFISTREYPDVMENFFSGVFADGAVTGLNRVQGDFYILSPGWLIMDAEISRDGNSLYYVNARFAGNAFPEESSIGIAVKSGSEYLKDAQSADFLAHINNADHLVYAPSSSDDGMELYFTRFSSLTRKTEICVSTRSRTGDAFSIPSVIPISGAGVEAPSISRDGNTLYYHKLGGDGKYHIYRMTRR